MYMWLFTAKCPIHLLSPTPVQIELVCVWCDIILQTIQARMRRVFILNDTVYSECSLRTSFYRNFYKQHYFFYVSLSLTQRKVRLIDSWMFFSHLRILQKCANKNKWPSKQYLPLEQWGIQNMQRGVWRCKQCVALKKQCS